MPTEEKGGPPIRWQEAVGWLAGEKTRAETAATLLKQRGDPATVARGQFYYGEAKAEFDAIVQGLKVALAQHEDPSSLNALKDKLSRAVSAREAFTRIAATVIPNVPGERGFAGLAWLDVDLVKRLWDGIQAIRAALSEGDKRRIEAIRSALDDAIWRDFATLGRETT